MGKQHIMLRMLSKAALVAAFGMVCAAFAGGRPYLPSLGPVPLRCAGVPTAANTSNATASATSESALAAFADTTEPAPTPEMVSTASTNSVATTLSAVSTGKAEGPTPPLIGGALPTFTPAIGMVGMTPQFLAEYFHPQSGRTNLTVVVPVDFSFTPPVPKAESSSRASYKVQ